MAAKLSVLAKPKYDGSKPRKIEGLPFKIDVRFALINSATVVLKMQRIIRWLPVIPQLPPTMGYTIIKLAGGFVRNLITIV